MALKTSRQGGWSGMAAVAGVALANSADGHLELVATSFGLEERNGVYRAAQAGPNGPWGEWQLLGGEPPGAGATQAPPSVARNAAGRLEAVVLDEAGVVWRSEQFPGAPWLDWRSLDQPVHGAATGAPVLTRNQDGHLEVFIVANNEFGDAPTVWHAWQQGTHWSSGWHAFDPPARGTFGPLAVGAHTGGASSRGRLALFAPARLDPKQEYDPHRAVFLRSQRVPNGGWLDWVSLKAPQGPDGDPLVVRSAVVGRNRDGRLELFITDSDGTVWHRWQGRPGGDDDDWRPWAPPLGSGAASSDIVAVGANRDGRLVLVASGTKDRDLWARTQQPPPATGWSDWSPIGSVPTGDISRLTLAANANGSLELFAVTSGTPSGVYQLSQATPDGDWSPGRTWPPLPTT
jgi:hypothetical protein